MPEGRCQNPDCNRLIYDTEKLDELQDEMACQHCGTVNIIRAKYRCRRCGDAFSSLAEVGSHARLEHKPEPVLEPEPTKPARNRYDR